MAKELYFGIDLGTTNSAISVVINNVPQIITLDTGKTTLPSCVKYDGKEFTVGDLAYQHRYEDDTIYSVKRLMGSNTKITLSNKQFTPTEISAEILKELKRQAERVYGKGNVNKVTITVPAYFTDNQKKATQQAGDLAGLEVVRIINEPTSASLAYSMGDLAKTENVLVFDLGGGTFDVNLIKMVKSSNEEFPLLDLAVDEEDADQDTISVKILSTDGDAQLGGDDFDKNLFHTVLKRLNMSPQDLTKMETEKAILELEQIKKRGTSANATLWIKDKPIVITRNVLEEAFSPIWQRALAVTKSCIQSSPEKKIDKIVLVGGSTKISLVTEYLQKVFPTLPIYNGLNPDESVALGASVQTWLSCGGSKNMSVFDVVPLPIGLSVTKTINNRNVPNRFEVVIYKDTPIPTSVTRELEVQVQPNALGFQVPVYQGFSLNTLNNTLLGNIQVKYNPEVHKVGDTLTIKCVLAVDINGVLGIKIETKDIKTEAQFQSVMGASSATQSTPTALNKINQKKYDKWKDNLNIWDLASDEKEELNNLIEEWASKNCPRDLADTIIQLCRKYQEREDSKQGLTNIF